MTNLKSAAIAGIVIAVLLAGQTEAKAQRFEISPFIGYETGSTIFTSLGYLYIGDGTDYGGTLDIALGKNRFAEISFSHMMTRLNVDEGYNELFLADLGVNYYSVGIMQETKPLARISPYGLLTFGLVNYTPQTEMYSSENKMHVSLAGGVNIHASRRIGFRLQARLLMPVFYAGANFSSDSGGADMTVTATSVAFQGDFTAALVFSIK